ncbi:MAG: hypothetical protein E7Z75_07230 [Methanobrevibacter olleyae]|uniref:Uncharacterized protein n=1 Tax=Methanobrevibacter olleyae TaxID=294671 RepID=A0A8T3VP36_METOL|nr:hypothetical protein [Methanobrevibacter olleyae]
MIEIPTPSKEEVDKYIEKWNKLENYVNQENSLNKLFHDLLPENKLIEDILIKASTLNDFYSTNIFSIFPVAKHIHELDIDERLYNGDLSLVDDIADVKDLNKRFYSFATKYCSHHNPDDYPIFDNYVSKVLVHFKKRDKFAKFKMEDLRDYIKFNEVLDEFAKFYNLEEFTRKELDMYLWQLGKEYFKRY